MKVHLPLLAGLAMLVFASQSCKNDGPPVAPKPLTLVSLKIERKGGVDCDKPDSVMVNCAWVNFKYPVLKDGSDSLKQAVDGWAKEFMTTWVGMAEEPDNLPPLDDAINNFFNMQAESAKEMPDMRNVFAAETTDTVLLNDGKHLTLQLDGYSDTGGAHPSWSSAVATWDVATAKKVALDQLVTDLNALQALAEKKFREVRPELFSPDEEGNIPFAFDETFPFKLADNTGLVKDGIFFCYVPYEVGPYAIGATEFVLTFAELGALKK
ncbi:MAG: DUF3298 and DUF4163 domain-containing protein [Saprospiraceae bacterium]|nr:DUF3298 and DUF4163 domain-containing protein [Saprospiraceae bacterium]